jgi:hypothetical protein
LRNCQIFSHSDQNLHIVRRKWQVPSPLCEGQDATSDSHLRWTACRTDHTCRAGIRCVHARAQSADRHVQRFCRIRCTHTASLLQQKYHWRFDQLNFIWVLIYEKTITESAAKRKKTENCQIRKK